MTDNFYKTFENKHRGDRQSVKDRLRVYLPFILPVAKKLPEMPMIDLGCGRGEWLELMAEQNLSAIGVDIDEGMLEEAKRYGLQVRKKDALAALESLPDDSQLVVSAFHLVEHVEFPYLQCLVKEAFRVLCPAGLLIMETPNPENLIVGSSSFYIDPTHIRPLPPELLAFLPDHYGFARSKIVRLQESKTLAEKDKLELLDVLGGVSPDYAIIAQKKADRRLLSAVDEPFSKNYGITISELAATYSAQETIEEYRELVQAFLKEFPISYSASMDHLEKRQVNLDKQVAQLYTEIKDISGDLELREERLENQINDFKQRSDKSKQALDALTSSNERLEKLVIELKQESEGSQKALFSKDGNLGKIEKQLVALTQAHEESWSELKATTFNMKKLEEYVFSLEKALYERDIANSNLQERILELNRSSQQRWSDLQRVQEELAAVRNSFSWRITTPLRFLKGMILWLLVFPYRLLNWIIGCLKDIIRYGVRGLASIVNSISFLRSGSEQILKKSPGLKKWLQRILRANDGGNVKAKVPMIEAKIEKATHDEDSEAPPTLANLSPHARKIYKKLKVARKNRKINDADYH